MLLSAVEGDVIREGLIRDLSLKIEILKTESLLQYLSPGKLLQGKVLAVFPGGKARIDLQGIPANIQSRARLVSGQQIAVEVQDSRPGPQFRLLRANLESAIAKRAPSPDKTAPLRAAPHRPSAGASTASRPGLPGNHLPAGEQGLERPPSSGNISSKQPLELRPPTSGRGAVQEAQKPEPATDKVTVQGRPVATTFSPARFRAEGQKFSPLNFLKPLLQERHSLARLLHDLANHLETQGPKTDPSLPAERLNSLRELLKLFQLTDYKDLTKEKIKNILEGNGAQFEARFRGLLFGKTTLGMTSPLPRDLKGELLKWVRHLEAAPDSTGLETDGNRSNLLHPVRQILQNIEMQQLTHFFSRQENLPTVLNLPLILGGQPQELKIFFRRQEDEPSGNEKRKPSTENFTLVFFLNLSALGGLRIDTQVKGPLMNIKLFVESQAVLDFFLPRLEAFQHQLADLGFSAEIEGKVAPEKTGDIPDERESLFVQSKEPLVDLEA